MMNFLTVLKEKSISFLLSLVLLALFNQKLNSSFMWRQFCLNKCLVFFMKEKFEHFV